MQTPNITRRRAGIEALVVFAIFMGNTALMNFTSLFDVFNFLPVLGRAIPNFTMAVLVMVYLVSREGSLAGIGVRRAGSWLGLVWWAILIAGGFAFTYYIILPHIVPQLAAWVMETFSIAPPAPSDRLAPLVRNLPLFLTIIPLMWVMAAFGEEVVSRGFLLTRIARAFGAEGSSGWIAWGVSAVVQGVIFGAAHLWAGPGGMIFAGTLGIAMAAMVFLARGNLWPAILLHGVWNTYSIFNIYTG